MFQRRLKPGQNYFTVDVGRAAFLSFSAGAASARRERVNPQFRTAESQKYFNENMIRLFCAGKLRRSHTGF